MKLIDHRAIQFPGKMALKRVNIWREGRLNEDD